MDKPEETPEIYLAILRAQIELAERRERNSRRKDGFKLPSCVYETLEDLGKIEAALAVLKTFWHKDNDDYRKVSMHLSKLAWDLRKKLHEVM